MERSETWRELLAEITKDPQERERIVQELNVNPITITRWINDESVPRIDNLRRLLNAVPERGESFLKLLIHDFPDIAFHVGNDGSFYEVTSDFYSNVFNTYVTTPATMRFWSISKLILQYLLAQLDSDLHHIAVLLLQCQQSPGHIIRSLRSVMGVGTPPWGGNLETQTIMLGAESFAGQVLLAGHPTFIESTKDYAGLWSVSEYAFPGAQLAVLRKGTEGRSHADFEIRRVASEMAAPVMRTERKAGVLYVCSTMPGAFARPHLQLLKECAMLITLAFEPKDFYQRSDIFLHILPLPWMQGPVLLQVSQRILQLMRETMSDEFPLDRVRAERIVWQQIEEELIQLASKQVSP